MNRNTTIVIAVLAAGIVAAVLAAWAVKSFTGGSATEQAMAQLRAQPLVGVVLADNPAIEARVRAAVEEDRRDPQATPRAFLAIAEIRRTVVGPTLAAADDANALAVMKARADLVSHLEKTDLAACRQFSGDGIRDVNKLDGEGQRLFKAMLTAMEAAYKSGKANGDNGKPATNEEFAAMLQSAGFTPDDFAKFNRTAALKDDELCALELRIDDAPRKLPEDKRGAFARFVIAH
jgi:hypothetical protein